MGSHRLAPAFRVRFMSRVAHICYPHRVRVLWIFIHFICAVFAVVGVALLVVGLKDAWRAARSRRWPTAPGKVISAEEFQHRRPLPAEAGGGTRIHYQAHVHYEYTVGRVLIGSTVLGMGPSETSSEARAQAILARYPPGKPLQVAYNPQDPTDSVLEPGAHPVNFVRAGMGAFFLLLVFAVQFIARWFAARL